MAADPIHTDTHARRSLVRAIVVVLACVALALLLSVDVAYAVLAAVLGYFLVRLLHRRMEPR